MILPSTIAQQLTSRKLIVARHSTNTKTANDSGEAGTEIPDCAAAVSPDGRAAVFALLVRGRVVEGAVARDALEQHFWLTRDADAACTLRTFGNGRNRIVAVAQRKHLARPDEPLWLTAGDFVSR